jgi:7-cyano-7-deazaguanine synthase
MEKANVLLLSGGVESVTLLHQLAAAGETLQALFIDYGHRGAAQEQGAAQAQCEPLGIELVELDLAKAGAVFRTVQSRKPHVPFPHRSLVALALGLSYATNLASARLYLAATRDDASSNPSGSHAFLAQFRLLAGLLGDVQLATPYLDLTEAEIVTRGRSLGVDYGLTYSCMTGQPVHCGRCAGCARRRRALREAGIAEPANFYRA